jgi:nucleoside-diphosphate-sugar epimerase
VIYDNILRMQRGEKEIRLQSSALSARDFSYVVDQALAIKFLGDKVIPQGEIFNIGSGTATKIIDVVRIISELMEYKGSVYCQNEQPLRHDVSWAADVSKISALGFQQCFSLRTGLNETIRSIIR